MNGAEKVRELFSRIADRYDFMNRLLSFGLDIGWRRRAVNEVMGADFVLDLCAGTADMALAWQKGGGKGRIVCADFCADMVDLGRKKARELRGIFFVISDAVQLPFRADTFDAVLCAYGFRNLGNVEAGLRTSFEVLKGGGRIVVLDFFRPTGLFQILFHSTYGRVVVRGLGGLISGNKEAYKSLEDSIAGFHSVSEFEEEMVKAGFVNVWHRNLSFGICSIITGIKPEG